MVDSPLSLSAPPPVPFSYDIPRTNMGIVFTSFEALLPSSDILSTFMDATLLAIDGMSSDPRDPIPLGTQLRWQQSTTEFSIAPVHLISYQTLANLLAGLQANMIYFGSIRGGMYATHFDIYITTFKIGSGRFIPRPPSPSDSSSSKPLSASTPANSSTATARHRALSSPSDSLRYRVPNTPISLSFFRCNARLSLPDVLYLLMDTMFAAAGTIRDSGQDVLIGRSWHWTQLTLVLDLYPRPNMSWRSLATAAKGMKDWMVAHGARGCRFDVDMDVTGRIGMGSLRRLSWAE